MLKSSMRHFTSVSRNIRIKRYYSGDISSQSLTSSKDDLRSLISENFDAPIRFCVAYGSAVYPQKGYSNAKNHKNVILFFMFHYLTAIHYRMGYCLI